MADRQRVVRLRDLGGMRPIPEWREVTWSACSDCGAALWGPADEAERLHDGEPLVCLDPDCGLVHHMSADAEGWDVLDDRDDEGRWVYLTGAALAGARRVLEVPRG